MLKPGDSIPDFKLTNQDGETVTAPDLQGRTTILFAFPKADTPGCTTQACGFRDELPAIEANGARVYGISPDRPEALKKWQLKKKLPYDLLSDPDHTLLDALGGWGEKSMFGRRYMGVIRSHWVFDEGGTLVDAQIKVSPKESVAKATAALTV